MEDMHAEGDDEFLDLEEELEKDDAPKPEKEEDEGLEIEIVDETPPEDKGKWVADDERDGPPDEPTEDEIKSYGKGVQERIKKLTARMHAERRRAEQLARENEEASRILHTYLNENNQLKDIVESGEKVLINEQNERLKAAIESQKNAWKKAHEAGDDDAMLAASEQIARLTARSETLANRRVQPLPRQVPPPPRPPQPTPDALSWAEKNTWFGRDEPMTVYAQAVHRDIVMNKGIQPETPEYWSSLDKEIRQRFPERFEQKPVPEEPRKRRTPVAGAQRSSASTGSRRVTLSDGEVRLARRLGLTNEQYAAEKMRLEKAND